MNIIGGKKRIIAEIGSIYQNENSWYRTADGPKIGISRSTFFRYLDDLKMPGAPVLYDSYSQCYYYNFKGNLVFGIVSFKEKVNYERH